MQGPTINLDTKLDTISRDHHASRVRQTRTGYGYGLPGYGSGLLYPWSGYAVRTCISDLFGAGLQLINTVQYHASHF